MTIIRRAIASTSSGVAAVMAGACWVESTTGRFGVGAWGFLASGLLGVGLGALFGGALGGITGWAAAARSRAIALSAALGVLVFWRVSADLRPLAMWHGVTRSQAYVGLGVCSLTAVGATSILALLMFGMTRARRWRRVAGLALSLAAVLACVFDQMLPFDGYPFVHWVTRAEVLAAAGGTVALVGLPRSVDRVQPWHTLVAAVGGLGLAALVMAKAPGVTAVALLDHGLSRFVLESARGLSDWDRDGYSAWFGGGDCAPFDATVNPGASDIPGNGIDDNCHGGDARRAPASAPSVHLPPEPAEAPLPSIVLITAEALRVDHLSLYGYRRDTTPELADWAKGAWRFDRAVSWTRTGISLPALFYGRLPAQLRWGRRVYTTEERLVAPEDLVQGELARRPLPAAARQPFLSLPGLLRQRGLRTLAVVDDAFSPYLGVQPGYAEEFDKFETVRSHNAPDDDLETATLARWWLRELAKGGPFFEWIHFYGTHAPSTKHWGAPDYGSDVAGRYDHEIRYLDQQLAPLMRELDELATHRPLVVLFVADHGESFSALDRDHGLNVDEANLHVPLLLKAPGLGAGVSQGLVSQLDIAPTLLAFAGIHDRNLDGSDLREVISTGGDPKRIVLSAAWHWDFYFKPVCSMIAAVGFDEKASYDRLRDARVVTHFGDFKETPITASSHERQLFDVIDRYLDRYGPVSPR